MTTEQANQLQTIYNRIDSFSIENLPNPSAIEIVKWTDNKTSTNNGMANPNTSGSYTCLQRGTIVYYMQGKSRTENDASCSISNNGNIIQSGKVSISGSFPVEIGDVISYSGSWKIWSNATAFGCISIWLLINQVEE